MAWLGAIDGTAESVSSFVKLWSGNRVDRSGGHKRFVVFGYALAALTRPFAAVIAYPWQLFGLRVAERLGKGIHSPPRDAMIADATPPEARGWAFGFRQSMDHIGSAAGTLVAAAFLWFRRDAIGQSEALRQLFLWTLLPGAAVVALLWLGLRASRAPNTRRHRTNRVRGRCVPSTGSFASICSPWSSSRWATRATCFCWLGRQSSAWPTGSFRSSGASSGRQGRRQHVRRPGGRPRGSTADDPAGVARLCRNLSRLRLRLGGVAHLGPVSRLCVFYALTEPAEKTLVANFVGPERRGLAYGWYNAAIGVATLPASLLFGGLYDQFGPVAAFGSGAAWPWRRRSCYGGCAGRRLCFSLARRSRSQGGEKGYPCGFWQNPR